jgi:hypothetical protein
MLALAQTDVTLISRAGWRSYCIRRWVAQLDDQSQRQHEVRAQEGHIHHPDVQERRYREGHQPHQHPPPKHPRGPRQHLPGRRLCTGLDSANCTSTIQEITEILETRWLHLSTDAICLAMHVCSLALRISALRPVQRAHGYGSGYARQLLSQRSISRTTAVGYILTLCDIFRSPTTTTIVAATEESSSLGPIRPFLGRKI